MRIKAAFLAGTGLLLLACAPPPEVSGRALFVEHCAACHGTDARGGGPLAAGLDRTVPDLTMIAKRHNAAFPMAQVMSQIDGYRRARAGDVVMPEFGAALQAGDLVLFDTGDGIVSPTPERLADLALYLKSIQR